MKKILIALALMVGLQLDVAAQMLMPATFSVSDSGAATYQIPIQVPPGILGIEPKLALAYSSQAGNLIAGVGWTVTGLSAIVRCPSTAYQDGSASAISLASTDKYCLDGQRLISKVGLNGADGTEYRTELETYSKIVSNGRAGADPYYGPSYFTVRSREGLLLEYGNTEDSRIEVPGLSVVRVWALNKISDAKGNYLNISYTEDVEHATYYPARIDYTGNSVTGLAPASAVIFDYQARPDSTTAGQGGKLIRNTVRLAGIRTVTAGVGGSVMSYGLVYEQSPSTARSRLSQVTACSGSGECFPPAVVTWDSTGVSSNSLLTSTGISMSGLPSASAIPKFSVVDMNNDGLDDIMNFNVYGTPSSVNQNNGDGTYKLIGRSGPGGAYISTTRNLLYTFVADMNGDGKRDVVVIYGVCPTPSSSISDPPLCASTVAYVDVYTDVNGDGVFSYSTWLSNGPDLPAGTTVLPPRDFTGDGRPDIAFISPGGPFLSVHYLVNEAGARLTNAGQIFTGPPNGSWGADGYQIATMDANLDGLPDLAVWRPSGVADLYINTGSSFTAFSSPISDMIEPKSDKGWIQGDFNGDGLPDIAHIGTAAGGATEIVDVLLNTGTGFVRERWASAAVASAGAIQFIAADVNSDGKMDIVRASQYPRGTISIYRSTGTGFVSEKWLDNSEAFIEDDQWFAMTLDGGSAEGFARRYKVGSTVSVQSFLPQLPSYDRVVAAGSLYDVVFIEYKTLPRALGSGYFMEIQPAFPIQAAVPSMAVVSGVKRVGSSHVTMSYGTLLGKAGGRSGWGFNWVQSQDDKTGIVSRKYFRQDFPFTGLVDKFTQGTSAATWNNLRQVQNSYGCFDFYTANGCVVAPGRRYFPYITQTDEQAWDLNGAALPRNRTKWTMDVFGNATGITTEALSADGAATGYSSTTVNTFLNDESKWWIGLPLKSVRTANSPESNPIPPTPVPTPTTPTPAPTTSLTPAQLMVILQILLDD